MLVCANDRFGDRARSCAATSWSILMGIVPLAGKEGVDQEIDFDVVEGPIPKDAVEGAPEPGQHVGMGQIQAEDDTGSGRLEFSSGSIPDAEDPVRVFSGQSASRIHAERRQPKSGLKSQGV